jgi:tripartite ATP-independent transporter DctP family solute receptor
LFKNCLEIKEENSMARKIFNNKSKLVVLLIVMMLILSACGNGQAPPAPPPGGDDGQEVFHWRFAHEEFVGSIQDVYVHELAALMYEMSDGRINFEIFQVGQIGDATQQAEMLQVGGIEFAMVSPGNTGTIVPENQLFSLHFLFPGDLEKTTQLMWESYALNTMLSDLYLERNLKVLSYWTYGPMEWTANRPLRTPADFIGLRMRTMPSPMIVAAYAAYGANPTPMPYLEVYSGLQLGMIDGQENPISAIEEARFYEVQDYLIEANSNLYFTTTATNPDFFNSLPADIQQIILDAVEIMHPRSLEISNELNAASRERIAAAGNITIIQLTEEERAAFIPYAMTAWDVYREMVGQTGSDILDRLIEEIEAMN